MTANDPRFNPYAPPQAAPFTGAQAAGPIRGEGKTLRFSRQTYLPNVCVKCGAREPTVIRRRTKQLIFVPWYGRLFGVIGYYITRRTAVVEMPICAACDDAYKRAVLVMWCTAGVPFLSVAAILAGAAANVDALVAGGSLGFVASFLIVPIVFLAVVLRRMLPIATKIEGDEITIGRVHPDATLAMVALSMSSHAGPAGYA